MTRETAPSDRTAIIVGAGIAGLATALSLARAKWSVIVLERAARLRGGAFVVGFSGMGYEAATRLGLVEELRARASPWRPMQQVDGDGRVLARMSEASQRALTGHRTVSILRGDLEGALYGAAQHVADIRFGQTVTDVTDGADGAVVTLRDGSRVAADLVIGADGAHSTVRRLVFGPEDRWRYDFGAKVASFEVIDPPTSVREKTTLLTAVGRSAGLYPQRDGRLSAFFTFVRDDAGTADAAASLGRAYGDLGWVWPDLIQRAVSAESIFFDDITQIRMGQWSRRRVVLVGDAAWAVSLLAGAGSSLAVGGGLALARHLAKTPDADIALRRWERWMRPRVRAKQFLGRRSRQLFLPSNERAVRMRIAATRVAGSPLTARVLGSARR